MEERPRKLVVDTYALLAKAFGELGKRAAQLLQDVRRERIVGLLPVTVAYEYIVHWRSGGILALTSVEESDIPNPLLRSREPRSGRLDKGGQDRVRGDNLLRGQEAAS